MSSSYQSPIVLDKSDCIKIHETLEIYGRNEDAVFNTVTKNYEVKRNITLTIKNKKYRLDEYHFHNPSEHKVNGNMYPAEIHYVFIETENEDCKEIREHSNICCSHLGKHYKHPNKNILVIGRIIINNENHKDFTNLQVKAPHYYYQYDGTLTTGSYSPVRWIIGETPVHYNVKQIETIAKPARPLQPLDGRIILYSEK
jgi:carbonic anhydrase